MDQKLGYYSSGALVVWTSFLKVNHWLKKHICWNIGNGKSVFVGIDPFVGDKDCPYLLEEITEHLSWINMKTMDILKRPKWYVLKGVYWLNTRDLGLTSIWVVQGDSSIENLKYVRVQLKTGNDILVWPENKKDGTITAKMAYDYLIRNGNKYGQRWWFKQLWE